MLACLALLIIVPEDLEPWAMLGVIVLPLVGWSLPTLWVRSRAKSRLEEMSRGMPDMLDLLNMCVSQGMTVPTALLRVCRELDAVYPALAKELRIVTEQSRVGTLDRALRGFSNRVDIPEVHSFTSLLIQTEQMGTSMSEALAEHSDSMRESFRQRADEKANSATFKMLFPTVLCLMPAVFLFLLGPAVIELNDFFHGRGQEILNASTAGTELVSREDR
jgi:tight adherence protein C